MILLLSGYPIMRKKILFVSLLFFSVFSQAQSIRLSGNVNDTAAKQGVPNVLLMAIKFNDSSLVSFTRSNAQGVFKSIKVPLDTYLVILSHPNFSDKTYLLAPSPKDTSFNFKNILLPPKSIVLNEVEIVARQEKSYYKGDTLIFTADSFKTAPNATVEDLLKKLPGVRVDIAGKITIQGKEVDQVLVDGDEFFGSDPTIATRNLNATAIENVQVFDKKNESTEEGANETLKVVNLKLKEDAKKGYFGKVSGATDFTKFYEGDILANKFKANQKISVFALAANTPKQGFGGGDADKYGLSGEQEWMYDDETGDWTNNNNRRTGIPGTIKSGMYYSEKIGKKTKLNGDYTFNQQQLWAGTETNTQFFLPDTAYSNFKTVSNYSKNQSHNFNFRIIQKLDSLTELTLNPKVVLNKNETQSTQTDDFLTTESVKTRRTVITNDANSETTNANIYMKLSRNFLKKDRNVSVTYQPFYNSGIGTTKYNTDFLFYTTNLKDSSLVQKRESNNFKMEHNATAIYTEPLNKKFKTELSAFYTNNNTTTNRNTYNNTASGYDLLDTTLSNNFDNSRLIYKGGAKLIYDVKKYRVVIGTYARRIVQENIDLDRSKTLSQTTDNLLPLASFNYRINQGSNLSINYTSNSQQPELQQMQPVRDNSDPNRTSLGNPNLRPTFSNNVNLNYYFYKGISDVNFWSGGNYSNTLNQISNATRFDSIGRAVTIPVNINGNYNANIWFGGGFPVFKKFMKVYYNFNGSYSNNVSIVNATENISKNTSFNPGLTLSKDAEKFNISLGGNYTYVIPRTNISEQSNQPYYTYNLEGYITLKLPKKFNFTTDGTYTNNGNRSDGFNLNYFILNASLSKTFLKLENLIVSINANDILNQNINNQRYISSNQIVDTKTEIIKRYVLVKVLYKFNSQKTKAEEDYDY